MTANHRAINRINMEFSSRHVAFVTGVNVMGISLLSLRSAGMSVDGLDRLFRPESVKASGDVAAKSEPHIELTALQNIALLRMAGSTLCRGVATHLQNENDLQARPSIFDYRALVAHGFAYKPLGDDWHKITPAGKLRAGDIARETARELAIHIMIEGGAEGVNQNYSCACGKWNVSYRRGVNTNSNALGGFARHCAKASPTKEAESA